MATAGDRWAIPLRPRTTEGWMVTLGGLNRFEEPVFTEELQEQRLAVLEVAADLEGAR